MAFFVTFSIRNGYFMLFSIAMLKLPEGTHAYLSTSLWSLTWTKSTNICHILQPSLLSGNWTYSYWNLPIYTWFTHENGGFLCSFGMVPNHVNQICSKSNCSNMPKNAQNVQTKPEGNVPWFPPKVCQAWRTFLRPRTSACCCERRRACPRMPRCLRMEQRRDGKRDEG